MAKTLIFGHKSPDTDTITAAISLAYLETQLGNEVEAVRLGEINKETAFALDYFGVENIRLVGDVSKETDTVMLVDHNERNQSADGLENVTIRRVVDHHRIANFETAEPLFFRAEPVGCTATILYKMYQENGVEIPKEIAGLMLSAIISDTLLFKSPTCTTDDEFVADRLAQIAGVSAEVYGLDMLKAGADLSDKTADELIHIDSKPFEMGKFSVQVSQISVIDVDAIMNQAKQIKAAMDAHLISTNQDEFVVLVTDIINSNSIVITRGNTPQLVENAFKVLLHNSTAELPGVVSRKKQVVPQLTAVAQSL
ncbi:manganese-dependent inorganic pyrophosphatase [Culicoidibacter larvae]|uniref:inorganic diphosphatase n=1 Tax=Culicoidibacter larvae TaxID=2579976 RepID=A0A5R8QGG3_9FIRM|nr:manganese-dependent inorganic pyrophosphatase [Culicoidibacter larvae]TLG76543.1 manganese-dependent inorganic pyrophosphatase [Culicoidibacter larvae]